MVVSCDSLVVLGGALSIFIYIYQQFQQRFGQPSEQQTTMTRRTRTTATSATTRTTIAATIATTTTSVKMLGWQQLLLRNIWPIAAKDMVSHSFRRVSRGRNRQFLLFCQKRCFGQPFYLWKKRTYDLRQILR